MPALFNISLHPKHASFEAGFSLIEIAVVLTIMGVLVVSALMLGNAKQEQNKADVTRLRLDAIEDAIYRQAMLGGYLSCPAPNDVQPDDSSFGVATDCSTAVASGVSENGSGANLVRIGAVPVRSLNLPQEYAFDGWNNRFTYMVIRNMALQSSSSISGYVTTSTTGVIQVLDGNSNQVTPATTANVIPYVVISHGKDAKGAYNLKGTQAVACGSATKDAENCDGDVVVMDTRVQDSTTDANYFFDYVRYKTSVHLQ